MDITAAEAASLYAEASVVDYLPETVTVRLLDGSQLEATCYNLPIDKVSGANRDYAASLLAVAARLGFPEAYLEQISKAAAEHRE